MPRTEAQNEAIVQWAREVTAFTRDLGRIAALFADEVHRIDSELAELRDDLVALANRQSSTDRVLAARTEHLA